MRQWKNEEKRKKKGKEKNITKLNKIRKRDGAITK